MNFLELFSDEHRERFLAAGAVSGVERGGYLIRRGEPGGDVYLLEEGTLEVVDTRTTPEVILAVLEPGAVVGEMSFLDDAPRSADVRASSMVKVRRWVQADLQAILDRDASLAAEFYKSVASMAAHRNRRITSNAVSGALTSVAGSSSTGVGRVRQEAKAVADQVKEGLLAADTALRFNASDPLARQQVRLVMDRFQDQVRELFLAHSDSEVAKEGARLLRREVHPYLVRSSLAERCIRRSLGHAGTAEVLAHIFVDSAAGDGLVGELLDRWFLDRPMFRALKDVRLPFVKAVLPRLPTYRKRHVLLINAGTGSIVALLNPALAQPPTVFTVMDQSRDALVFVDSGITVRPRSVELRTVQENLAAFARGRSTQKLSRQDAVLMHGLLEYLPDRLVVSMLRHIREYLTDEGVVVISTVGPSEDHSLLDRLLSWPTVRRTGDHLAVLFGAAGFAVADAPALPEPQLLFVLTPR
ncbi:MAG: cyclic nucleotide-binding domain-containing protein [Deltaproteobacteria bacterium]|nr:cyclic nucleotide-binding domain-containing protein [Deltaproteobacteria bacterium]